ncbi:hypothetical protein UT300013_16490 [Paraclostridium sordellii]
MKIPSIMKITIKDILQNNQDITQLIGIENFKKLVKYMGGSSIYIPKEKNLILNLRNQIGGIVKHETLLN